MRVLLAVLLVGIAGCGEGSSPPGDVAAPSSPSVTPVKAENAEADGPKPKADKPPAQTLAMKETNNTDWIFEALAVRLGENEVDHKQIVNTFGPLVPAKERFLCRWLEKGKSIEMVGEIRQSTTQGDQIQRMYVVCRYDPETNIFVQTVNADGKSKPWVDLTWNRKTSRFEAEHSVPEPVDARAILFFKWTDNKTLKGEYRIVQGEKVLFHEVFTGQKTKPTANNQEFDKLKSSILAVGAVAALQKLGALIRQDDKGEVFEVYLAGTKITDAGLVHLKGLSSLQKLELLYGSKITDAGLVHLKGLTNLETLTLNATQITDAGLVHLKELTNLQTLSLVATQITDVGLVHLKGMTKLKKLFLAATKITDAGLVHLKGLSNLTSLNLSRTKVTDAGVADLQKALPNCKILKYK